MKNKLIMLLLVGFLTACGTTSQVNTTLLDKPIPKNEARIIVERDTSLLYLAASVTVEANGKEIANLGRGGSVIHDVSKGENTIKAFTFGELNESVVRFDAEAGKTYNFMISPQDDNRFLFGIAGEAVRAEMGDKSGYFKLEMQELEKETKK